MMWLKIEFGMRKIWRPLFHFINLCLPHFVWWKSKLHSIFTAKNCKTIYFQQHSMNNSIFGKRKIVHVNFVAKYIFNLWFFNYSRSSYAHIFISFVVFVFVVTVFIWIIFLFFWFAVQFWTKNKLCDGENCEMTSHHLEKSLAYVWIYELCSNMSL